MFDHLVRNREAFDAGAAKERKRIAQDIHDHVGATLLDALHSRHFDRKDRLIRETLSDLREIISGNGHQDQPIGQALAQIRRETAERLEASGIGLDWRAPSCSTPIDASRLHAVHSIIREGVSNALKHADCRRMRIAILAEDGQLTLMVEDDGKGFDPHGAPSAGAGLGNIRERVCDMGGAFWWASPDGGFISRLHVRLPLSLTT